MKRYRVNFPLLIGLIVAVIVLLPSFYFLWRFQVERNAVRLKDLADKASAEDKLFDALDYMSRYVALRPDDTEGLRVATGLAADLLQLDDSDEEQQKLAFDVLNRGIANSSDPEVRRHYVEALAPHGAMGSGAYARLALGQIDELIESGNADAELYATKVEMLHTLRDTTKLAEVARKAVGLDPATGEFSAEQALAADQPVVYRLYAIALQYRLDKPELADRVIARMTEVNPDSADAFLWSYEFKLGQSARAEAEATLLVSQAREAGKSDEDAEKSGAGLLELAEVKREEALADLANAFEIAPDNDGVLKAKGDQAIGDYSRALDEGQSPDEAAGHLEQAAKFLEEGAEKYPRNIMFILQAARVEAIRDDIPAAIAILDRGLKTFKLPSMGAFHLASQRLDFQLQQNNQEAVEKSIAELRKHDGSHIQALANYYQARLEMIREKWSKAAALLGNAKFRLIGFSNLQAIASMHQGTAHERLGQLDLAASAYEWALKKSPELRRARESLESVRLRLNPRRVLEQRANTVMAMIAGELDKDVDLQDWDAVDAAIDEFAKRRGLSEARVLELKAETLIRRAYVAENDESKKDLFEQARELIREAYKLNPTVRTRLLAIKLLQVQPGKGPKPALELLDRMVNDPEGDVEDSAPLRMTRAELLAAIRDDDVTEQLLAVLDGIEDWSADEQASVYREVGRRLMQVGASAEAQSQLDKATELAPNDLPTCRLFFNVALQRRDAVAIQTAQDRIKQIVGGESAPDYILTEVRRRLTLYETKELSKQDLKEAEKMLDDALKARATWSDLWVARGQILLLLNADAPGSVRRKAEEEALQAFDTALETGHANAIALRVQINLLYNMGRTKEALSKMELLSKSYRPALLERTAAAIYAANGMFDEAYEAAKATAEANSTSFSTQLWFSEMAVRAERYEDAEKALRTAVKLNAYDPQVWSKLIGLYAQMKEYGKLESVLREAHLSLDEEYLPLLNARYYELQGRWHAAEDIYLSAYRNQIDTPAIAQRLAEFYVNWPASHGGNPMRAAPHINTLLRLADEGLLEQNNPMVAWSRRRAARLLASQRNFAAALKAEKILDPLVSDGEASIQDVRELARILSGRLDPAARIKAIALWQRVKDSGQITTSEALLLGKLMSETGRRGEAQRMIEDLIARDGGGDLDLIRGYATLLIEQREYARARRQIASLERKGAAPGVLTELELRLAARSGNEERARELLEAMTPDLRRMTQQQLESLPSISNLANELGDHEYALQLITQYARRNPAGQMELARLQGLYGDAEEAIDLLKRLFPDQMDDSLLTALAIMRTRRPEVGDKLDSDVERLVRRAVNDDPENARRLVLQAEMLEIEEKFDESVAAYESLLERSDLPDMVRATALNNLAFLLALKGDSDRLDESLQYVTQAVELLGPISDILDTRAAVQIARGEFDAAVKDMRQAIQIGPTPGKFFHLAQAELAAGNEDRALEAWSEGIAEGLSAGEVSLLEQDAFQRFSEQIQELGGDAPDGA